MLLIKKKNTSKVSDQYDIHMSVAYRHKIIVIKKLASRDIPLHGLFIVEQSGTFPDSMSNV